ncbi:aminopeptidase [Staphylococcus massiliensis CCUG 55927]|uniref:AbrB family transcriptional regulator n=1 Tax=Staphylococcus massiliensis TaxID=555791 RepID=UPI00030FE147|nr:AbrB family transcriptional regulator [Staphylococcus massiliensis]PNZ97443.1 aminopeptidase [Staphylococcus massiliensis CCUG 55927]
MSIKSNALKQYLNIMIVIILSLLIGGILNGLHIMLPWMFGPIIASIICIKIFKLDLSKWPNWLSNLGLIILGLEIGTTFTKRVLKDIQNDLILIILVSLLIILSAFIIAIGFKRIGKVNFETAILSVVPGGISQMLMMAEENKRADILVVGLTQTSRMLFVVVLVPLLSFFFKEPSGEASSQPDIKPLTEVINLPQLIIIGIGIAITYYIMKKIKFPTRYLLAPIVVMMVWNLITDINFTVDNWLMALAQIFYMVRIGKQISELLNQLHGRIAIAIAFQNITLILVSVVLVFIINIFSEHGINQLFLSAAPGGMTQIVIIAIATHADVAMISSYHIFRIFFILFIIAPLIHLFVKKE